MKEDDKPTIDKVCKKMLSREATHKAVKEFTEYHVKEALLGVTRKKVIFDNGTLDKVKIKNSYDLNKIK